ncbi:DUF1918 domain-containing protein [Mycolicibacterium fortuitum]|nr:DUF1918 domain-containing protein [Mycolicibacterium fortuitum]
MIAEAGDWLVIKGSRVDQPDHRGLITEVHSSDGTPPYIVRWLDSDHVAMVYPGPDAIIVKATDQKAADERAQRRFGRVQSEIQHTQDTPGAQFSAAHGDSHASGQCGIKGTAMRRSRRSDLRPWRTCSAGA